MPDTVIITIRYGEEEADFELPSGVAFGQWRESLIHALRRSFYGIRLEDRSIVLRWQGIPIPDSATPAQCGIYDGSILQLEVM